MYSPLEQFNIVTYFNLYIPILGRMNITNITIYLIVIFVIIIFLTKLYINLNFKYIGGQWHIITNNNRIKKNKFTNFIALIFSFWEDQVKEMLGEKGTKYLPLIQAIFIVILTCNIIGLIPYSYTLTSQYIICVTLSISIFVGITILGIYLHKLSFFSLFVPSGVPIFILPLIIIIEFISYLSRVISLSVRLCANLASGHILLKIIATLGCKLPSFFLFVPFSVIFLLFGLELGVSLIQAYVFTLLSLIYIKDVRDISH